MPRDLAIPKVLYKYRTWDNDYHKLILTHNVAYFSSARDFNDPFDCAIPIRYDLEPDEHILSMYKKYLHQGNPDWDQARVEAGAQEWFNKGLFKDEKHMEWAHNQLQEAKYNDFGLFTVSEVRDNLLMWSHYSGSHRGFCVGLDGDRLEKRFDMLAEQDGLVVDTKQVHYHTEYPYLPASGLPDEDWLSQQFIAKSADWSYEREWRYILFDKTNHPLCIPKEAIVEVILGCDMPEVHKTEIKRELRKNAIHARLYQAVKSKSAFALEFEPVEY